MPIRPHRTPCAHSARIVQSNLGAIGIHVSVRDIGSLGASFRSGARFDLLHLRSDLPYPDPASYLEQFLEDLPAGWIPPAVSARVRGVMTLNGTGASRRQHRSQIGSTKARCCSLRTESRRPRSS